MKTLNTFTKNLSKIIEVLAWIGAALAAIGFIATLFFGGSIASLLASDAVTVSALGLSGAEMAAEDFLSGAPALFAGLTVHMSLFAMIFRNIYLTFQTSEGKTWFSKGATPFQDDVVRMIREVGIFAIAIPFVDFFAQIIFGIMAHASLTANLELTSLLFGLVIICLSQYFAYGVKLEADVDGLI